MGWLLGQDYVQKSVQIMPAAPAAPGDAILFVENILDYNLQYFTQVLFFCKSPTLAMLFVEMATQIQSRKFIELNKMTKFVK